MFKSSSTASAANAMAGAGPAMYLLGAGGNALLGGFDGVIFSVALARDYDTLIRPGYLLVS